MLKSESLSPSPRYEYKWAGIPIILVFIGGALGAAGMMTHVLKHTRIFDPIEQPWLSIYSGSITIGYTLLFIVLATVLQIFWAMCEYFQHGV